MQSSIKILLIEDNPDDAQLLKVLLKRQENQFQIDWVTRLSEGLEYLSHSSVDTVLLDLSLPDASGMEAFEKLHAQISDVPILILTGQDDTKLAIKMVQNGAQDFLFKSEMNGPLLERSISYAIERKYTEEVLQKSLKTIQKQHDQMQYELEQAKETQKVILPTELPQFSQLRLACEYVSMEQIGGDFYDVIPLQENKIGLMVADVTGHGIAAALLSFMISTVFKETVMVTTSPQIVFTALNGILLEKMPDDKFATMFYGVYDFVEQSFVYCSAGHPPGLVLRPKTQEIIELQTPGIVLGALPQEVAKFEDRSLHLLPGDRVLIYTDGIMEVHNETEGMLGKKGLHQFLLDHPTRPIDTLLKELYDYGLEYTKAQSFNDDVTLMGIEILEV